MVPYLINVTCHHCDARFKLLSVSIAGYHSDGGLDWYRDTITFYEEKVLCSISVLVVGEV